MTASRAPGYFCPMHRDIRQAGAGTCARCGMALVREDARFAFLRHVMGHRWMLAGMILAMAAMAAVMALVH
jgi:hypothetical protein